MTISAGNDQEGFWDHPETRSRLWEWIDAALQEDRAREDATTRLFDEPAPEGRAVVTSRQVGIACGSLAMAEVFLRLNPSCQLLERCLDGERLSVGSPLLIVAGPITTLLAGERIALNIGAHLSGIATRTWQLVECAGQVKILDTRKTMPGIRIFQKQAVRVGGGSSHRMDLAQFPMVKENHREWIQRLNPQLAGDRAAEIAFIVDRLRTDDGDPRPLAIEVEDEESLRACLHHRVEIILVDNTDPQQLGRWLQTARDQGLDVESSAIEASGGIDEETVSSHAQAGIDRISCGAITHSAAAVDLTMAIVPGEGTP